MAKLDLAPMLCSVRAAAGALDIGVTKTYELITDGQLETVTIGARRLVKIASVRRLAGIDPDQPAEVSE